MKELTVDAKPASLPEIKTFVTGELEEMDCPDKTCRQILVAVDESSPTLPTTLTKVRRDALPCASRRDRSRARSF